MLINLLLAGLLCGLSLFYAWRYSKLSADPDWAFFNLYSFTGALYGRDFADCKTPGVHIWYALLGKLVGASVPRIKFANHLFVSLSGVVLFLMTHNFWAAFAYIVVVNSGWLIAFHGNVGQVPAALVVIALVSPAAVAIPLWLAAVFYEPKLILAFGIFAVLNQWWILLGLIPVGLIGYLLFRKQQWFKWLWESCVTVPGRMIAWQKSEHGRPYSVYAMPWFLANGLVYFLPWFFLGAVNKPDLFYWLPVVGYIGLLVWGY